MNPVLIVTHNNLELTKRCVDSLDHQDISNWVHVVDNDSTDGTWLWIKEHTIAPVQFSPQIGVSAAWNVGLKFLFDCEDARHVLVVNNDTILPPWFYRRLLDCDVPFVTGATVRSMDEIAEEPPMKELIPAPDFSAFLIRRDAWKALGGCNEAMFNYASDCDFHVRAHRKGIRLLNSQVAFYHEGSATIRNSNPKERRWLDLRADADREEFRKIWGMIPGQAGYSELFNEELFGVDA